MTTQSLWRTLQGLDDRAVEQLNALARASPALRVVVGGTATQLASVEVVLMTLLAIGGRRGAAMRMLAAVAVVYVVSEALGAAWPRPRPFARLEAVAALAEHAEARSFPSRHVASGLAMASIGQLAQPRLGVAMTLVAGGLGLSRIAAGLHYPSDVVGGGLIGLSIGRWLRAGGYTHRA